MPDFDDIMKRPDEKKACPAYVYQEASVSVPVEVVPYAKVGTVKTYCKGDPIINCGDTECQRSVNNKCHFTITQKICVKIPVEFGAETLVGSPHIQCETATFYDLCTHCDMPEIVVSRETTY